MIMDVLIACEFSGRVRDAFTRRGHHAISCDLGPTESPGPHYRGDVRDILNDGWDLMIAHPPCTHLAISGARWFAAKARGAHPALIDYPEPRDQVEAIEFVRTLLDAPIDRIALENPVSVISSKIRKPDQIIQPWQYGHPEPKTTCLWLKNLPPLQPTRIVEVPIRNRYKVRDKPPGPSRSRDRSLTYPGIAEAMAEQWGGC